MTTASPNLRIPLSEKSVCDPAVLGDDVLAHTTLRTLTESGHWLISATNLGKMLNPQSVQ